MPPPCRGRDRRRAGENHRSRGGGTRIGATLDYASKAWAHRSRLPRASSAAESRAPRRPARRPAPRSRDLSRRRRPQSLLETKTTRPREPILATALSWRRPSGENQRTIRDFRAATGARFDQPPAPQREPAFVELVAPRLRLSLRMWCLGASFPRTIERVGGGLPIAPCQASGCGPGRSAPANG